MLSSYSKPRVPNATPASPMRSTSIPTSAGPLHKTRATGPGKPIGQVEVQEVFDLDDLHSDWSETFMAKKYYVWVPNTSRKQAQREQPDP